MTKASSTTWFWILGLSGSWPLVFGRTRIWIRESSCCFTQHCHTLSTRVKTWILIRWVTNEQQTALMVSALKQTELDWLKMSCCRYGFLSVFASTDGGITRVFPNVWVRLMYLLKPWKVLVTSQIFCPQTHLMSYVCTELLSYGMRILNPSIRTTTDGASTTKATCSDLHTDPVSNCTNTSFYS